MASEEPSLPRLPAVSWDEHSQSFSNNPKKRGRFPPRQSGASILSFNSSDPAVFSSDDDPALDNYVEGRRKKRYVGSWFQQQPASSDSAFGEPVPQPKTKRTLARQLDSGVFLGSDGTECDDMLELEIPPRLPQLERAVAPRMSESECLLQERIQLCLENGDETIDFMSMDLEELSNETVMPLSHLTCIPQVTRDVAFEQKDPELKLYLSQNRLSRLPGALFDLTHLTTLSLRGNQLQKLPPAIGKLCNLQELNISQNRLSWLPVEILNLLSVDSKLRTLLLHPNPFSKPDQGDEMFETLEDDDPEVHDDHDLDMEPEEVPVWHMDEIPVEMLPRIISRRLARSPLQVSDSSGRIVSRFNLPLEPTSQPLEVEAVYKKKLTSIGGESNPYLDVAEDSERSKATRVPSLLETVMRTCYRSEYLGEFKGFIPDELSNLRQLFDRAVRQKEAGGLTCSRCRKTMVVPALEWIEWREVDTLTKFRKIRGKYRLDPLSEAEDELVVPFLHRACSWRCGPGEENSGWEFPTGCQGMTIGYCLYNGPPVAEE
ncbi:hypothetical protein ACO1O0_001680 [Amphichorda felina]